jgi:hypothetical protein
MADGKQINLKLTPGEILIVAGAFVTLVFSFLHFYTAPTIVVRGFTISGNLNAWASALVPTVTIIVLFNVVMAVQVVLTRLFNIDLGPGILGFSWPQVHVALGFFALLDTLAFIVVGKGGYSVGIGLIFMLIGSAACFVGAILVANERGATSA